MAQSNLNFGRALELLKQGKKVARAGWNGQGVYLVLVSGGSANHPMVEGGADVGSLPSIGMWTVNAHGHRAFLNGWLASQIDMLAEDWGEVS